MRVMFIVAPTCLKPAEEGILGTPDVSQIPAKGEWVQIDGRTFIVVMVLHFPYGEVGEHGTHDAACYLETAGIPLPTSRGGYASSRP
jgi:hypothetical protein